MTPPDIPAVLTGLALALLLTWTAEGIVTFVMTKSLRYLLFNIWCNTLTNPLLNTIGVLVMYNLGYRAFVIWIIFGEVLVLISEARLYAAFDSVASHRQKGAVWYLRLSFVTNLASVLAGVIINKTGFL